MKKMEEKEKMKKFLTALTAFVMALGISMPAVTYKVNVGEDAAVEARVQKKKKEAKKKKAVNAGWGHQQAKASSKKKH